MPTVRRLNYSDLPAFRSLRRTALLESPTAFSSTTASEHAISDEQMASRMEGASFSAIWGAGNANGLLVGCAGLLHIPQRKLEHKGSLYAVYVAPCARGTGLGRRLLEAAIAYARGPAGLRQLQLGVTANNTAAIALYQKLGFDSYGCERDAIQVDGVFYDEILMQLRLHP